MRLVTNSSHAIGNAPVVDEGLWISELDLTHWGHFEREINMVP
jgi:hypothetical protein